jgi:predicted metalloendopeptidase
MKRSVLALTCASLIAACSAPPAPPPPPPKTPAPVAAAPVPAPPALTSGIGRENMDTSVRAQDDFYRYVNGHWLDTTEIPADKPSFGTGAIVYDAIQDKLRGLVDDAAAGKLAGTPADTKKIGDLYASFMDEATVEQLDAKPLAAQFAAIDALKDKNGIPALIAQFGRVGLDAPYTPFVHQDNKDSTKYIVDLGQSGLGLPDRDYYLLDKDAKLKGIRDQYVTHVEKMLNMAGDVQAAGDVRSILALETALAKAQWTKVELRDPIKGYNQYPIAKLDTLAPGLNWDGYLDAAGIKGKVESLNVGQPTYITALAKLLSTTPLPVWKAYFKWQAVRGAAPYLSKRFVDENFAFYGTVVRGVPENRPRWKRGLQVVDGAIGEELGKLYTAKYFPPESKARAQALVANLLATFKQGIDGLDWMSAQTKQEAQAKLAKFTPKIGYPDKWRDYSALTIDKGDLLGNVTRANAFEYQRNIDKLGKPIDRAEWGMTPQTLNAYYNPELNEIVFPAAILQPPFFDPKAEDAVNYGSIGAVIGHEISHGFDDQGAQYDGDGNLRDWWTKEDHEKFAAKTRALVAEYSAFEPVKGYHLNGELTLGENIADNSGLAVAYKAYLLSLGGKPAPVIDGFTGAQRFYAGFAQVWRAKQRDNATIQQIKTDPHSMPMYRAQGTVVNQPAFYEAFDIKPGDKMYVAPEKRVTIW